MTEDLIRRLMAAGLTKQQASSVTAETLVKLFMPDDGKVLIREAQGQVAEMRQFVNDLKKEYTDLKRKVEGLSDTLLAISEAQKEHGVITDEKARNVVALYAALLTMGEKAGADAEDAVRNPCEQGFVPENVFLERLPEIAKNAIADACTGSNPRQPSQEEMEKLLKCCYYDTEVDF